MSEQGAETASRFTTFLDAVVAIALTLLVLPLVDLATERAGDGSLLDLLRDNEGLFASFALSFVVILRSWRAHHRLLGLVGRHDRVVRLASEVWLLSIVVLPFPTRLLSTYGSDRLTYPLYVGTLTLSIAALAVLGVHVARTPELLRPDVTATDVDPGRGLTLLALVLVALVLGTAVPAVGYSALLLLLLRPVLGWVRRSRRR